VEFQAEYVAALQHEIAQELASLDGTLETVFFGGGTPTQLSAPTLGALLKPLLARTSVDAEISLEANPENLDFAYLQTLRKSGFNRLSLGAQSFNTRELQVLGRAHDAEKIENVVREARRAGFDNLSLDLIYGAPGTSLKSWRETLTRALALGVTHISAYSLTIESGTAFGHAVRKGELLAPNDDFLGELMDEAAQILSKAGFERYEVSNYAKPGFESRHNLGYWRGDDYLGLGCGAHGHRKGHRFWNERDAKTYISRLQNEGTARAGEETLTPRERATELVALGLRCREGFNLAQVSRIGDFDARRTLNAVLASFVYAGTLQEDGEQIVPSPAAFAVADGVAARLIAQF
jgi:oxygen-independent coproporphyrinogen-3 oxidase